MKKLLLILGFVLCASPAFAQSSTSVTTYREDTTSANGEQISMVGVRRCNTTPTSSSSTNGNRVTICADANGRVYVNGSLYTPNGDSAMDETANAVKILPVDSTGAAIADESAHDASYGSLAPVGIGGYSGATPCTAVSADGEKVRACYTRNGAAYTQRTDGTNLEVLDPCTTVAKTTDPISLTADAVIIAATSGKKNYICSLVIVAGAAEIASITEGTGTTCNTSEAALVGSTTDANGMSFAANGGVAMGSGLATVVAGKTANVDTCLNVSGSNRVSGFVTWVQR